MDSRFDAMDAQFNARFDAMNAQFNARFDATASAVAASFDRLDHGAEAISAKLDQVIANDTEFDRRLGALLVRMRRVVAVVWLLVVAVIVASGFLVAT